MEWLSLSLSDWSVALAGLLLSPTLASSGLRDASSSSTNLAKTAKRFPYTCNKHSISHGMSQTVHHLERAGCYKRCQYARVAELNHLILMHSLVCLTLQRLNLLVHGLNFCRNGRAFRVLLTSQSPLLHRGRSSLSMQQQPLSD